VSDVDQYAAEAAAIRNRIADSVESLGERLSPSRLIQDAKEEARRTLFGARDDGLKAVRGVRDDAARVLGDVRERGADVVDDVEGFVRENPLAAGTAAAFVGVLLAHNRTRKSRSWNNSAYYDDGDSYTATAARPKSRTHKLASEVHETVSDVRDRLGERISAATDKVADTFSDVRHRASARVANVSDRARAGVTIARDRIGQTAESTSDRFASGLDSARDAAGDAAERAQLAARRAVHAAAGAIEQEPEAAVAVAAVVGVAIALALENGFWGGDPHRTGSDRVSSKPARASLGDDRAQLF